jgi:hypothetical protein
MEEASMKGVYVQNIRDPKTGAIIKGVNNSLAKYIFGTIEGLAKAQIELLDKLTWDVLQTGEINHLDPRTKLNVSISYKNPHDTSYNHFPAALSGGAVWSNYSTANGIQDLYNAVDTYVDTNGFSPKAIVMGRKTLNHLLQQQSTKDAATQVRGSSVGSVSMDLLGGILSARQLPSIITMDERYKYEASDKSTSNVRFHQEGRFTFVAEEMGVRAIGPTLENAAGTVSGVYVKTYQLNKMSPTDISTSVASTLPCILNPKLIYSQQVI